MARCIRTRRDETLPFSSILLSERGFRKLYTWEERTKELAVLEVFASLSFFS